MTALQIACRLCAAQPGESCHPSPNRLIGGSFHEERILDAATMTRVSDPIDIASFDEAVEKSGLV